eukprot:TRINITY_DN9731_c0_g1_i6.p1 TRINITY_DN9731_c0_g1~~TRINITY_DN9731_c0_g1_i6.p1  ORF type:complete len:178 (-),score=38.66 TRINITY_DN9731_c0_g1_i6:59-592(-)
MMSPDNGAEETTRRNLRAPRGIKLRAILNNPQPKDKLEVITEVIPYLIKKEPKNVGSPVREGARILEVIKKAPLEKRERNVENGPLESLEKANASFRRRDSCIPSINFIVLKSQLNRSAEIIAKQKGNPVESKSRLEEVKREELYESNCSNKSPIDSSDKVKLAGPRIAFMRHDSYI